MDLRALGLLAVTACQFHAIDAGITPTADAPRSTSDAPGSTPDAPAVTADAAADAASAPACATGALPDTFTDTSPCQPWGAVTMSAATVTEGANQLTITPASGTQTFGGCTAATDPTSFTAAGEFIEVTQAVTGDTAYTTLNAYPDPASDAVSATLVIKNGDLNLQNNTDDSFVVSVAYDAATMRWLRLRPVTTHTTGVAGDYSADGTTWTPLGIVPGAPPSMIRVDFGAGTDVGVASPGMAVLANLDTCP